MKHNSTAIAKITGIILAVTPLCLTYSTAAQTPALWTGSGDGVSYNDANNWDTPVVPINGGGQTYHVTIPNGVSINFNVPGAGNQVTQLSLGNGSTLTVNPGRDLEVIDEASIDGMVTTDNGVFTANSAASLFPGGGARIHGMGGGQVSFAAPTYVSTDFSGGDLILATDVGTLVEFPLLQTISANANFSGSPIRTIAARNGGALDLSNVTEVVGGTAGDSLRLQVASGGSLDVSGLQTISGGNVRMTSDGTPLSVANLQSITAGMRFELAAGMNFELPSLTTFDGTGTSFDSTIDVPDNGTVTANGLVAMDDVDISIGDSGSLNATSLATYTRGTLTLGANQTWNSGPLGNIDGSRIRLSGGANLAVTATGYDSLDYYSNSEVFTAEESGTLLDLSSMTSLDFNQNFSGSPINTIAARNNGRIDLSGVVDIVGGTSGDSLRLEAASGGTLDLSGLQSISGGNVRITSDGTPLPVANLQTITAGLRLELATGMNFDLPSLTTFDGTGTSFDSTISVPGNGTVTANALVAMDDVDISFGDGGTMNATNLGTFTRGTLTLGANQTWNPAPLGNIDGSRIRLSGGANLAVTATGYDSLDYYSNSEVFTAEESGTLLDLSSMTSLDFNQNFSGSPINTIAARNNGRIDLSGVVDIVGGTSGDSLRLEAASGGTLDLSGLQSISGGNVRITSDGTPLPVANLQTITAGLRLELAAGMNFDLPSLTTFDGTGTSFDSTISVPNNGTVTANALVAMDDVDISMGDGGSFLAANLGTYTRGTLTLGANQTWNSGALGNIDGSRIRLSGGANLAVTATRYDSLDYYSNSEVFTAEESGTLLDLSSMTSLDFNQNFSGSPVNRIAARNGGRIDLNGVVDIVGPTSGDALEFLAESGGQIDVSSLASTSQNVRFVVRSTGQLRMGSYLDGNLSLTVTDTDSVTDVAGSWNLGPASSVVVNNGGELEVSGNFSHQQIAEASINLDAATVRLDGNGGQLLEVAGEDLGVLGAVSGNFGVGQLVIGQTAQRTSVDLVDVVDNGNRGGGGEPESLYLYGLGGPAGLRILNDSALILNGLNVYAFDPLAGTQVHLNSLFGPGELRIPYDDGFLQLVPLDFQWANNSGGDFGLGQNWSDGLVPLGSDGAIWNLGSVAGYSVQFGTNVATDSAIIKNDRVIFELNGFSYNLGGLHATDGLVIGQSPLDSGKLTINNGSIVASSGRLAADAASTGTLIVTTNASAQFMEDFKMGPGASTLEIQGNGSVTVRNQLFGSEVAMIDLSGGRLTVGTGTPAASVSTLRITSDGTVSYSGVIDGDVENNGVLSTNGEPAAMSILGDYTQEADGSLQVTLNGILPGEEHDQLVIEGLAALDGTLELSIDETAFMSIGQSLVLLESTLGLSGEFTSISGIEVDADRSLAIVYSSSQVLAISALPGDANLDGVVDVSDFNLWNTGKFTSTSLWGRGDFNGDGVVDVSDFNIWNQNKFTSANGGAAVPEPQAIYLLGIAILFVGTLRHCHYPSSERSFRKDLGGK